MDYTYLYYLPILFIGNVIYKMGKDYIEVTYHEKWKTKVN